MKRLLVLSIVFGLALSTCKLSAANSDKKMVAKWRSIKNSLILHSRYAPPAEEIDHNLTDEIIAAVKDGKSTKVEDLLKRNANPEAKDDSDKTLLDIATERHTEAIAAAKRKRQTGYSSYRTYPPSFSSDWW